MFRSAEFLAYFCTDNLIINHLTQCYTMAQHLLPGRRGYDPHFVSAQSLLWPLLNHQQQVLVAGIFHSLKCHLQNELSVALRVIQMLTEFVRRQFPQHAAALLEVLEPFADEVAEKLGGHRG